MNRRATRELLFAIALLAVGCSGTNDDLPDDVHWSSTHFDYYTRANDPSVCESVLVTLERHRSAVVEYLGLSDGADRVDYRKFHDARDYLTSGSCPDAGACTSGSQIQTSMILDEHELIHAYLATVGHAPPLFAEGVAQALSCFGQRPTSPDAHLEWRDAVARSNAKEVYPIARWFVGYLLNTFGPKPFLDAYAGNWSAATPDEIAKRFELAYGRSMDDAWSAAFSLPDDTDICVHPWECAAPPLNVDGSPFQLAESCDGGGLYKTVAVDHAALLLLEGADGIVLANCSGNGPSVGASTTADQILVELGSGTSFLASTSTAERPRASVLPQLLDTPACAPVPFPQPVDRALVSWTLALRVRPTPVVFSLSTPQHAKFVFVGSHEASVDACSDCTTGDCESLSNVWVERNVGALRIAWPAQLGKAYDYVTLGVLGVATQ